MFLFGLALVFGYILNGARGGGALLTVCGPPGDPLVGAGPLRGSCPARLGP